MALMVNQRLAHSEGEMEGERERKRVREVVRMYVFSAVGPA